MKRRGSFSVLLAFQVIELTYERDFRHPDYKTLIKLADFFEESLDYLIRGRQHHLQTNNERNFFEFLTRLYNEYGIDYRKIADTKEWDKLSKEDLKDLATFFEWLLFRRKKE